MKEEGTVIYVKRNNGGRWHIRESVIANDAITKCGRRMADEAVGGATLITVTGPSVEVLADAGVCEQCGEASLAD